MSLHHQLQNACEDRVALLAVIRELREQVLPFRQVHEKLHQVETRNRALLGEIVKLETRIRVDRESHQTDIATLVARVKELEDELAKTKRK